MPFASSSSPKSRDTVFIFITVVSLLLIFSYYLFVYVPSHEDRMHEQHIRILNKIAQNVKTKIGSTIKNGNNIAQHTVRTDFDSFQDGIPPDGNEIRKRLNQNAGYFNNNIAFEHVTVEPHAADHSEIEVEEASFGKPSIHISDSITEEGDTLYYHLSISAENLLTNLLRFDHFEKFALFDKDRALFETHPTGSNVQFDSLTVADNTFNTIQFKEVTYGGIPHIAYFRPLRVNEEQQWVLAGFVSSEKMAAQKFSLSPLFSIILLLVILLVFLSIPFIKLKIMHIRERLSINEVVFSFVSVAFIVGIVMLLILTGYTYWGIDKPKIQEELKDLSEQIGGELRAEVDGIVGLLSGDILQDCGVNLLECTELKGHTRSLVSVENIFLIDSTGMQIEGKWSISDKATPVINVRDRQYYQKSREPDLLCSEGFTTSGSDCFYLESIISYNTGKQLAAISIPARSRQFGRSGKTPEVIAATGRFHSIIKTVMPFGFGYAILNGEGDVLFHSEPDRNLQENFFEELESPEQLEANIFARKSAFFKTNYHDESTLLYVEPIDGWPVSLVTFYDSSMLSLKYLEIYTLHITIVFLTVAALILVFLAGFVIEKWGTNFWKKAQQHSLLNLDNFAPRKSKITRYRAVVYSFWLLLLVFLSAGALCWVFSLQAGIFLATSVLLVSLQYWILRYFLSGRKNFKFRIARIFESVAIGFGILLYIHFLSGSILTAVLFSLVPLLLQLVLFNSPQRIDTLFSRYEKFFSRIGRLKPFRYFRDPLYLDRYFKIIFLGTLSFSLFLTGSIYIASYLQETEAVQKYGLIQFSKAVAEHDTEEKTYFYSLHRGGEGQKGKLIKIADIRLKDDNGIYFGSIDTLRFEGAGNNTAPPYLFYPHPYQLRLKTKISTAHIFNETNPGAESENIYSDWEYTDKRLFTTVTYPGRSNGEAKPELKTLHLSTRRASLYPEEGGFMLLLFILLALLTGTSNSMVKQVVRQLFVLPSPKNYQFQARDFEENLKSFKQLLAESRNLYLTTLPVQFREILQRIDEEDEKEYDLASWDDILANSSEYSNIPTPISGRALLITGFDLTGEEDNTEALKLVKRAMQKTDVVLISNYDPLDLLHRIKHRGGPVAEKEHDMLTGLLAEFETYYFPLTLDTIKKRQAEEEQEDILVRESNIYYEIWNSLTPDEQYVMYDLATDGLVNTQNQPIIHRLYKKGLITENENHFTFDNTRYVSSLEVFSGRFVNFISNLVETDKIKELEEEINASGTWRKYRTPLLITLTAILLFIFVTQQETYGEIVGVLGSIAASTPLLLKLLNSLFAFGGKSAGSA